jgi:hypothetical protein
LIDNSQNTGEAIKEFQLTTDTKSKLEYSFGLRIAQSIQSTIYGSNSYFSQRNNRFLINRNIANGRIDVEAMFKDKLDFDGKENYINISWKALSIISTTISGIIGAWLNNFEKVQVTAIDSYSTKAKKDAENDAIYYHENKEQLQEIQQAAGGYPIIPKDQFVAEDKDELDEWVTQFNRTPEEIKYELAINNILEQNGFYDTIKEMLLTDSAEVGLLASMVTLDENGEVKLEYLNPEDCFYSYSKYPDLRDTSWRGHLKTLKISELRVQYGVQYGGVLTEEQIFKIAATAKEFRNQNNLNWVESYNYSFLRPYDEWNITLMCFEIRSVDTEVNTFTQSSKGNTFIEKGYPKKVKEKNKVVVDKRRNIYYGVYHSNTSTMLEWGLQKNMVRPQDPKEIGDAEFAHSFYLYKNYDMRNLAIPEKIEQPVEQMILICLQMQKLVASMTPSGAAVNVDAMQELFLGIGDKVTTPLEAERIQRQTGRLYYKGRDAEGNPIPMPITEMANNGFSAQMQSLRELYQFQFQVLKDQLGEDPNLGSAAARPRVTQGNVQAAVQMADYKTDYMYDAYLRLIEDMSRKVACLLNTSVTYQAKKYRELFKQDEVKDRIFSTSMKMLPTQEEIATLQMQMQTAVASNPTLAVYLDQAKIIRIAKENVKLASDYFRRATARMIKTERDTAAQNAQENGKIQQASIEAKAKADMEHLQTEIELKSQLETLQGKNQKELAIINGVFALYGKGLDVNDKWKPVVDELIQNVAIPLFSENLQQDAAIDEAASQQQGMQEQQPTQEQVLQSQQQNIA